MLADIYTNESNISIIFYFSGLILFISRVTQSDLTK